MTAKQFRDAIARIGLTQVGTAAFLSVGERTTRRWAAGHVEVPEAVAKLLRLMVRLNLTPDDVR